MDSLIRISRTLTEKRVFDQAVKEHGLAEKIALEQFGRESVVYGNCCFNRGRILYFQDDPDAEKWYLEAKRIQEKTLGDLHADYAKTLSNLALVYDEMGNYEKAEPLHLEALAIKEKTLGKTNPSFARSLNNLALLYTSLGNHEKAERYCREALEIMEKTLGKTDLTYVKTLSNLATLNEKMGRYEAAEQAYRDVMAIQETTLGRTHRYFAWSQLNLAVLHEKSGRNEQAEQGFLDALASMKNAVPVEYGDYASGLNKLANLYSRMSRYDEAEQLFREANRIWEQHVGPNDPDFAGGLTDLAVLYKKLKQYDKVEPLFLRAAALREKVLGREHPDFAISLNHLATFYWETGRQAAAQQYLVEARAVEETLILMASRHLSEKEMPAYTGNFAQGQDRTLSFARTHPGTTAIAYSGALFHKGFLLEAAGRLRRLATSTPEMERVYDRMKHYRRRLAQAYMRPIGDRGDMTELEEKADAAEKELVRTVAGFEADVRLVTWTEVRDRLEADAVAVEFVHHRYYTPARTDSILYAALLLRPGFVEPIYIPLFEERQLDSLVSTKGERLADYVNQLYQQPKRSVIPAGKMRKSLFDLIWRPLEKHLDGVTTVYYSASGLLHRLNLAAISINPDSILANRFRLIELGSTRQLVIPLTVKPVADDAILFGGIHFDADSAAIDQANTSLDSVSVAARRSFRFMRSDTTLQVWGWYALPYTEREVDSLGKILTTAGFQSQTRRGYTATEEAFKTIGVAGKPSPRLLHAATHGFFFSDPKTTSARFETSQTFGSAKPVFTLSDHPMIRSGLVLAGGNQAWITGKPLREGLEDGILTAYEISQMNLSNTELVVLSACETGLGDIQGNEGVYGLQRAFKIAGARYLIMSLWQVPDRQTSILMTTFYNKWLKARMAIPEAFRAAQEELRQAGLDPYYWAGFVLLE